MNAIEIIDKMMEECPNFADRLILLKEELLKLNDELFRLNDELFRMVGESVLCEKRLLESEQKTAELMKELEQLHKQKSS